MFLIFFDKNIQIDGTHGIDCKSHDIIHFACDDLVTVTI